MASIQMDAHRMVVLRDIPERRLAICGTVRGLLVLVNYEDLRKQYFQERYIAQDWSVLRQKDPGNVYFPMLPPIDPMLTLDKEVKYVEPTHWIVTPRLVQVGSYTITCACAAKLKTWVVVDE